MLDLGKTLDVDEDLEEKGVWHDLGDGAGLLIGSSTNKNFLELYRKLPSGIKLQLEKGTLPDKISREVTCNLVSKAVLLDWKGIGDKGKEIKYSQENAKEYLLKYKKFFVFVWTLAEDETKYLRQVHEELEKN